MFQIQAKIKPEVAERFCKFNPEAIKTEKGIIYTELFPTRVEAEFWKDCNSDNCSEIFLENIDESNYFDDGGEQSEIGIIYGNGLNTFSV